MKTKKQIKERIAEIERDKQFVSGSTRSKYRRLIEELRWVIE
jgi:hypothetical protein